MFPFGFGLSYTSFEYSGLVVPEKVNRDGDTKVLVTVKNTGTVRGDEVVQLYLHDELASVARPVKELKAFNASRWMREKAVRWNCRSRTAVSDYGTGS
jgi:beta-glucosidase